MLKFLLIFFLISPGLSAQEEEESESISTFEVVSDYGSQIAYEFAKYKIQALLFQNSLTLFHELSHALIGGGREIYMGVSDFPSKVDPGYMEWTHGILIHFAGIFWSTGFCLAGRSKGSLQDMVCDVGGGLGTILFHYSLFVLYDQYSKDESLTSSLLKPFTWIPNQIHEEETLIPYVFSQYLSFQIYNAVLWQLTYALLPSYYMGSSGGIGVLLTGDGSKFWKSMGLQDSQLYTGAKINYAVRSLLPLTFALGMGIYTYYYDWTVLLTRDFNYFKNSN